MRYGGPSAATVLGRADHRPWPLPESRWVMAMRWERLAFLHWRFPRDEIQRRLPDGLRVDLRDGDAWIGIVPFLMSNVRLRGLFPVPGTTRFAELNVRTYVTDGTRPGVWFFSLDAASRLAVRGARTLFHLPYFDARMCLSDDDPIDYESERTHRGSAPARFRATYRAAGDARTFGPGSVERWLTERYCLYAADRRGRIFRGDVHHAPWALAPGEVDIVSNGLLEGVGLPPAEGPPLVHVARPLDVLAWPLRRVHPRR